jgi:hypothetical protein
MMYNAVYTDTGEQTKTIIAGQIGAGQELLFTIKDEDGDVVDLTDIVTNMKIYIGVDGTLVVNGGTVVIVAATSGTCKYVITNTDFTVAGLYDVEIVFADNAVIASATEIITAGGSKLKVEDSISS